MTKKDIIIFLKQNKSFIKDNFGIEQIGLFGSYAKDSYNSESDVDILVDLKDQKYDSWFLIKTFLEKSLGKKVDVITNGVHLKKQFLDIINKDLIYV